LAVQIKLSELIIAVKGAENKIACVEELTEDQLEAMRKDYRQKAEDAETLLLAKRKPKARNGHASGARF
jgi:low affinity Fe/Cu permease